MTQINAQPTVESIWDIEAKKLFRTVCSIINPTPKFFTKEELNRAVQKEIENDLEVFNCTADLTEKTLKSIRDFLSLPTNTQGAIKEIILMKIRSNETF